MKKPRIILKEHLLMPLIATEKRVYEIRKELEMEITDIRLNGLFLMLVSYIESMQKEIIKYYLKYQPEKIPNKLIQIETAILIENEDFYLLENIVAKHVDKMQYWEISKLFYEILRIEKPTNDDKIKTIKERRNELIHNNLKVDFKRKEIKQDSIDLLYLKDCLDEYEKYLLDMKVKISQHFIIFTKLYVLEKLWHYTFKTSLCSNFSDYWYIDTAKDCITGCKNSEMEDSLSSSEKFMLEIWRSQVCGGKVNFPNMASLDKHSQNHLYLFLKLSNDLFLY
ncbi:hypothetical protein [Flavobacterium sp. UBA7680]|uniref:hypothetical protein n=1 Tax=Flavobacterium sp. UBA7680 TaxID=1946559 RepID=UPI0025BC46CC|nr:hypothetical protein [Flavobacterium sp. UBA7680]